SGYAALPPKPAALLGPDALRCETRRDSIRLRPQQPRNGSLRVQATLGLRASAAAVPRLCRCRRAADAVARRSLGASAATLLESAAAVVHEARRAGSGPASRAVLHLNPSQSGSAEGRARDLRKSSDRDAY